MPELPEVEKGRRLAERVAEGRRVIDVRCARDAIVFEDLSPVRVRRALLGRRVRAVRRRGKYIWFELDERPWPLFHFGMTGAFRTRDEEPFPLASDARRPDRRWPPRFTKLRMVLEDGGEICVTNRRRLGRVRLREDPAGEPPVSRLGFDPLLDLPSAPALAERIRGRKICLKGLLLDQSFSAGVGNWIADEVLYQARLDPRRPARSLDAEEAARLRAALRRVVTTAVGVNADKARFPRTWLFHRRWGRKPGARTVRGEPIRHITLAGRTTAWVPSVQV